MIGDHKSLSHKSKDELIEELVRLKESGNSQIQLLVQEASTAAIVVNTSGEIKASNDACLALFDVNEKSEIEQSELFTKIVNYKQKQQNILKHSLAYSGGITVAIPHHDGKDLCSILVSLSTINFGVAQWIFVKLTKENNQPNLDLPSSAVMTRKTNDYDNVYSFDEEWQNFSGIPSDQLIKEWVDLIHPDDFLEVRSKMKQALSNRKNYRLDYRLKNKWGKYIMVQETGIPRYPEDDVFSGFIIATIPREISSSSVLSSTVGALGPMIVNVTPDGFILSCNHTFANAFQLNAQQLFGRKLNQFIVPKNMDPKTTFRKQYYPESLHEFDPIHCKAVESQFSHIELDFFRVPGKINSRTNLITLVSTSIQQKEESPRKTKQTLRYHVLDDLDEMIGFLDLNGNFEYVNISLARSLARPQHKVRGISLMSIVGQQAPELRKKLEQLILKGDKDFTISLEIQTSGKNHEIFHCTFSLLKDQEGPYSIKLAVRPLEASYLLNRAQEIFQRLPIWMRNIDQDSKWFPSIAVNMRSLILFDYACLQLITTENQPGALFEWQARADFEDINLPETLIKGIMPNTHPSFLEEERFKHLDFGGTVPKHIVHLPLQWSGETIGHLLLINRFESTKYSLKDLLVLEIIAPAIAQAITDKEKELPYSAKLTAHRPPVLSAILDMEANIIEASDKYTEFWQEHQKTTHTGQSCPEKNQLLIDGDWQKIWGKVCKGEAQTAEFFQVQPNKNKTQFMVMTFIPRKNQQQVELILQDYTDQKKEQLSLTLNERKYRKIFERSPDVYFRCNLRGKVTMVSPSALEVMGYTPADLIGKNVGDFYLYKGTARHFEESLLRQKQIANEPVFVIQKSGRPIYCFLHLRYIKNENGPLELEGYLRDMSELNKTQEKLRNTIKAKDNFLSNMSHEIRTPMNGIIGMVDLIEDTHLTEEQSEYVDALRKSSQTLMEILNDILDLSKIQSGRMELRPAPKNIRETITKLFNLFSPQAENKGVDFEYIIDENVPEHLLIDETRLLQILSNLTANALKFTEAKGFINIYLKVEEQKAQVYKLRIEVKDSGIGIDPAYHNSLFQAFEQGDHSTTKTFSGAGLGLTICRKLCRLMNGEINVNSMLGLGSTFWFTFEAGIPQQEHEPLIRNLKKELVTDSLSNIAFTPSVLLVDDNFINRKVASEILLKAGCKVMTAESGQEAIEKVQQNSFDLVFMDIQMPQMDGVQTTKNIKALGLKNCPPIIAMTAYALENDRQRFIKEGLDDYLAKPIRAQEIIQKVKEYAPALSEKKTIEPKIIEEKSSALNKAIVDQLYDIGGYELIAEVYENFDLETKELLSEATIFAQNQEYKNILGNLHTLKGNAATLGVDQLAEKVKNTEQTLKKSPYSKLNQDLEEIGKLFDRFSSEYKSFLDTYKNQ